MAAPYPTNYPLTVNNEQPQPTIVYVNPYYDYPHDSYDRRQTPVAIDSTIDRTAEYVASSNADVDSYPVVDPPRHDHRHHQHHTHPLPSLTIRRHAPGSNDPSLQKFPAVLQSSDNVSSSSNVHVTIKRNSIPPDQPIIQPVIQPVLYPVAVYVESPVPQYPMNQPIQAIPKPPSPRKPMSPIKISPTPPMSPNRYDTELLHPPSSRLDTSLRRPIRIDLITPTPPILEREKVRSAQIVMEEFDDYDEYYRVPTAYSVPEKVISYRTAPGMTTTRELENNQMDHAEEHIYVQSPQAQTVTYRIS